MLADLFELLRRFRTASGGLAGLTTQLEAADGCAGLGDAGCVNQGLEAITREVEAQAGADLTKEQARVLKAAEEGLRATRRDR
jgi:hypothetical protein